MRSSRVTIGVAIALAGAYAWWVAGLRPFTAVAYLAIALPSALLAVALVLPRTGRRTARGTRRHQSPSPLGRQLLPITTVLLLGLGLEIAGLALGGRSSLVPTLSTFVDHALRWQLTRFLLVLAWLAAGVLLALRSRRQISADEG
jgi:hypothetical protein